MGSVNISCWINVDTRLGRYAINRVSTFMKHTYALL